MNKKFVLVDNFKAKNSLFVSKLYWIEAHQPLIIFIHIYKNPYPYSIHSIWHVLKQNLHEFFEVVLFQSQSQNFVYCFEKPIVLAFNTLPFHTYFPNLLEMPWYYGWFWLFLSNTSLLAYNFNWNCLTQEIEMEAIIG